MHLVYLHVLVHQCHPFGGGGCRAERERYFDKGSAEIYVSAAIYSRSVPEKSKSDTKWKQIAVHEEKCTCGVNKRIRGRIILQKLEQNFNRHDGGVVNARAC